MGGHAGLWYASCIQKLSLSESSGGHGPPLSDSEFLLYFYSCDITNSRKHIAEIHYLIAEGHGPHYFQKTIFFVYRMHTTNRRDPHFGVAPTFEVNARPLSRDKY